MTKTKVFLTASAFLLAVGAVFAAKLAPEPGYYFDNTRPINQKCVTPKECQLEPTVLCTAIVSGTPTQLYRLDGVDDCQTTALYEIPQ